MSFYTKFQDAETVVTSTTTANLLGTSDPVLVYSGALKRAGQATAGTVATLWPVAPTATSATTATNLPNYGQSVLASSVVTAWLINDPTAKGQIISIFNTSSTSTANNVNTVSATIVATDTQSGITFGFGKSGAYLEAVALSTSQWLVTGRSAAGLICT